MRVRTVSAVTAIATGAIAIATETHAETVHETAQETVREMAAATYAAIDHVARSATPVRAVSTAPTLGAANPGAPTPAARSS
jgi:hypothetical protein